MNIAFVGIGAIGSPMALRLMPTHTVTVFDLSTERVAALVGAGATAAPTAADAAAAADIVIVMVATPAQLTSAMFGDSGVAAGLREGATLIVMSSVGIDAVIDTERQLSGRGITVIDSPVTGGVVRARTGELTLLVGGPADDIASVQDVLSLMGAVAVCGPRVGDGQAVKLVNQLLCSVHLAVAGEALQYAKALGLSPEAVLGIVGGGAASSFMLNDRGPRMLDDGDVPVLSAVDIFVKDSDLVREAAAGAGADVPLLAVANDLFRRVSAAGLGRADDSAVITAFAAPTDQPTDRATTAS